jgi:hypothetical protein
VQAQQPARDRVVRAGPRELGGLCDAARAPDHLGRGTPRERQQQDASRIRAGDDELRDPVCERRGLAGAGTCDHQQRHIAGGEHGVTLRRVERLVRIHLLI